MKRTYIIGAIVLAIGVLLVLSLSLSSAPASAGVDPYCYVAGSGTLVPGTEDTGNHCDDCTTTIALPFSYQLYDQTFTGAVLSSNGNVQFVGDTARSSIINCLPDANFSYTIFPHWGDLVTDCFECGIFTSVSGSSPNRIFNIEWRVAFFKGLPVNFELRLYEGQTRFDVIYGSLPTGGAGAIVGVQLDSSNFTQYECNTVGTVSEGMQLTFSTGPCVPLETPTPTVIPSPTPCSGRVTVCHSTTSGTNAYAQIKISACALPDHLSHGDIYPVPEGGSPGGPREPYTLPDGQAQGAVQGNPLFLEALKPSTAESAGDADEDTGPWESCDNGSLDHRNGDY